MEPASPKENKECGSSDGSSLTLSITPPLSEPPREISEHLSSFENDRSLQELEVSLSGNFSILAPSLNTNSIISLNGLANMEASDSSFDIFANVNLDDNLLDNLDSFKNDLSIKFDEVGRKISEYEELVAVKESTIAALTQELDSFKEFKSNTSTNSLGTSTTEYKQFNDEFQNKLSQKDEQIEKLTNSLQLAIFNKEEMKQQLKTEIEELKEELQKALVLLKEHKCNPTIIQYDFNEICSNFEKNLSLELAPQFLELKQAFNDYLNKEKKELEIQFNDLKVEKNELEDKHSHEMEELRQYFEKKCADLEKNYSDEIFSRKMSGSSSENELPEDIGPGGDFARREFVKLEDSVMKMNDLFKKFNVEKNDEFESLKQELGNLLKCDLGMIRSELQNKYHAELEILREDFENRVDLINISNEEKLKGLEKEIEDLNTQLNGRVSTITQQEVVSSGDFEIDEVVQSYERRLQEQVTLAKIDLIAALENQIQRLAGSDTIDGDWPEELLVLKSRFAEKYEKDMLKLSEIHQAEISRLKEEHIRVLERARRRSLRDADSLSKGELELIKERDNLKKQTLSLRNLLGELVKYFTQCEDELNNTLVEELINKNISEKDVDTTQDSITLNVKRVHITPNFNDLINLIDNSNESDLDSIDLQSELGICLQKLKSDANAVLALSTPFSKNDRKISDSSLEKEVTSLKRKLINETQIKNDLGDQLSELKSFLEVGDKERINLESHIENLLERQKILESELINSRAKIAELIENGHKEIISQGYGENGEGSKGLDAAIANLADLQEKVRELSEKPENLDSGTLLLMEELSRAGDKINEESKLTRDDFKQQIEAADKKYRVTCQFLEEQAAEREQERDEAQKEMAFLREQLKEREKDRVNCERFITETEHLEQQLRDVYHQVEVLNVRCKEVEEERKEAVEKIFELREIIRVLEEQVKGKSEAEEELRQIVNELEVIVKRQSDEEELTPGNDVSDVGKLHRYVGDLENEVQKLRLSSEIAGSEGALQQIKNHLCEFEVTLDKRTKDLESLHSSTSNTTCSSPSEEMSIRDVVQEKSIYEDCEVPLQQLSRLKEKLVRHSRAEDAAIKRIRDLELQILSLKNDLEESQNERDILKRQISDHLVLISNLQIRLDEQRIRAEHIEKQTNTSLEVQNYDLKNNIITLEEKVGKRDKTIQQLRQQIEETKKRVHECEMEIAGNKEEDELIIKMQEELEFLRSENNKLKEREMLPNLVENIISDKNNDIEKLKERLSQLEVFNTLNLDKKEIESLSRLKLLGVSFEDIDLEQARRISNDDIQISPILSRKRNDKTILESDISSGAHPFHSLPHSTEKHVRFEDDERKFQELEEKFEKLQKNLEETESSLRKVTESLEKERLNGQENERLRKLTDSLEKELEKLSHELNNKQELELLNEKLQHEMKYKDVEMEKIQHDIEELENVVKQKDKIISQMEVDSKSLHLNLETIQNKLQETGNIVDLGKRLREEQKKNSFLYEEIHELKAQLFAVDRRSLEDITDQVQKELNYSLYLDSTLINAVSDSSIESEDLEALRLSLRKHKAVNKQLAKSKDQAERKFDDLEKKYEFLRKEFENVQSEDTNLITELRVKLEQAVKNKEELEKILKSEKNRKYNLETQLKAIKNRSTKSESLPEVHNDYNALSKIISNLQDENLNLQRELKLLQDATRLKDEEVIKLECKFVEVSRNEELMKSKVDMLKTLSESRGCELARTKKLFEDNERMKLQKNLQNQNKSDVSEQLLKKIQELNEMVKNDREMMAIIERLRYENGVLEERITTLEDRRELNLPFDDPVSRANYLFAKFLRSESYRKALVWQKRYLISILDFPPGEITIKRRKPSFKSITVMIVSIIRMKYLVKRWHSGKRITHQRQQAQFHVGQPVSSQNFTPKSALNENNDMPWFGTSPPSKEPSILRRSDPPLTTPALLSKYMERFNQIQDRLGLGFQ